MNFWTPEICSRLVKVTGDTLRPGGLGLTKDLIGLGNFADGSRILDAGCGRGATLRHLAQTGRLTVTGVDGSAAMLEAARSNSGDASLVCAELESLPFGEASFDAIVCECVLSQTDLPTVLAQFQRVLRPGGLLLVSDLYRKSAAPNHGAGGGTDRGLATKEQLDIMLEHAGFSVEQWEDRTRDLRQLAIQLIMAPGPAGEDPFGCGKPGCTANRTDTGLSGKDVGYHLLVARRSA
jgi:SAM-dependent methyltransferase